MPRDSNGNASLDPVYLAVTGTTIQAVQHNTPLQDITSMLTGSVARNGAGGMLADLNMNGFTITNLEGGGLAPADGSVTTAKLAANAVTPAKLALGAWTDVASASTVDLGAQASRNLRITGTTTITSFGTAGAADNVPYLVRFAAALTLTNGAPLILPGAANITTVADDVAVVMHDTASVWRVVSYVRAANKPLIIGTSANNLVALDGSAKLPALDGSQLINATGVKQRVSSTLFTPSAGGLLTWSHGLSGIPSRCWATVVCQTSENGFSVGSEIEITGTTTQGSSAGAGVLIMYDSSNVYGRVGTVYLGVQMNASTGQGGVTLSISNWKVKLWAEL